MSDEGRPTPLGVVLKTTPLRESDLLVTLFTDLYGRISAVARGARRSKVRFSGTLSLLVLGRFRLGRAPRGDLWSLEGGDIEREWTQLASDPVAVAHASYVAEIVGSLLPPEVAEPEALHAIISLWESLADGGPSPAALRSTELALLELAGHQPAIDRCAACSETSLDDGAVFDASRGGALCTRCAGRSRSSGVRMFSTGTRMYLRAVEKAGSPDAARALDKDPRFTSADRVGGREAMVAMVVGLVGRPLRSLEYMAKLGAAGRRPEAP